MDANNPLSPPTPAIRDPLGGGALAPAGRSGFLARVRAAVSGTWGKVILKATAVFVSMVGLAIIGAFSTLAGTGVPVAGASPPAAASGAPSALPSAAPIVAPAQVAATPGTTSGGVTPDGKVVLNQATLDELMKLPRVGAKRAQAILDLRKRLGRFRQPTDLLRVRGIGRKTLRAMLPLLVVDAVSLAAAPRGS